MGFIKKGEYRFFRYSPFIFSNCPINLSLYTSLIANFLCFKTGPCFSVCNKSTSPIKFPGSIVTRENPKKSSCISSGRSFCRCSIKNTPIAFVIRQMGAYGKHFDGLASPFRRRQDFGCFYTASPEKIAPISGSESPILDKYSFRISTKATMWSCVSASSL